MTIIIEDGIPYQNQGIIFDRQNGHPGYVLVGIISKGSEAQTTFVRSLKDNLIYVRKHYNRTHENGFELGIHNITNIAPKIIYSTNTNPANSKSELNIFIYEYCNGGDVDDFCKRIIKSTTKLPEVLFWILTKRFVELLAYLHAGWHYDKDDEENWHPIVHGDVSKVNFFLSWREEEEDETFPRLLLGDWSSSRQLRDHTDREQWMWNIWKIDQKQDVEKLLLAVELIFYYPEDENVNAHGRNLSMFEKLVREGQDWEDKKENEGKSIMKYIAERFVPIAEAKIEELKAKEQLDFRAAMPNAMDGHMVFTQDADSIRKSFEWMDEDKLPKSIRRLKS